MTYLSAEEIWTYAIDFGFDSNPGEYYAGLSGVIKLQFISEVIPQ